MTCHRLEEGLLGDLGEALDPHIEQCPDCSARVQGYHRIAGWIADGRTMHRPSAEWRNRMLAGVLGDGARLRSIPPAPSGTQPMATVDAASEVAGARPAANALADSEAVRAPSASRRPRRRWARAVLPIAGAVVAMAAAAMVWCGGDRQGPRVAIERPNHPSGRGEMTRSSPDNEVTAVPHAPGRDVQEHTGSAAEASALPSKVPGAGDSQGASKQPASTRHPGGTSGPQRPVVPTRKRGGEVVVDWGGDGSGSAADAPGAVRVAFDPPTGDFGGLTADEVQRVLEARVALYRACYVKELARAPTLRGKLVVQLQIDGDGRVQDVDRPASSESTLRNEAVAQCVTGHLKRLVFPAKGQMARVTSSLDLTQRD